MRKVLLGALVGGIILFGWQAISWTGLGIHDDAYKFSPAQDSIINYLQNNLSGPGQYLIPRTYDGASQAETESFQRKLEGKPWAVITYHDYYENDMLSPVVRGLLISIFTCLLVNIVLYQFGRKKFVPVFYSTVCIGMVSFLFVWYNGHNWFSTPWSVLTGELVDAIVGWSLCGAWLGLWYGRK